MLPAFRSMFAHATQSETSRSGPVVEDADSNIVLPTRVVEPVVAEPPSPRDKDTNQSEGTSVSESYRRASTFEAQNAYSRSSSVGYNGQNSAIMAVGPHSSSYGYGHPMQGPVANYGDQRMMPYDPSHPQGQVMHVPLPQLIALQRQAQLQEMEKRRLMEQLNQAHTSLRVVAEKAQAPPPIVIHNNLTTQVDAPKNRRPSGILAFLDQLLGRGMARFVLLACLGMGAYMLNVWLMHRYRVQEYERKVNANLLLKTYNQIAKHLPS